MDFSEIGIFAREGGDLHFRTLGFSPRCSQSEGSVSYLPLPRQGVIRQIVQRIAVLGRWQGLKGFLG